MSKTRKSLNDYTKALKLTIQASESYGQWAKKFPEMAKTITAESWDFFKNMDRIYEDSSILDFIRSNSIRKDK